MSSLRLEQKEAPRGNSAEAAGSGLLAEVIRATAERMRQEQALADGRRFVLTALRDAALESGWRPYVPAMIRPWERCPIAYTNGVTLVTLVERKGDKWYVEVAAASPSLVVSGTVAHLLRGSDGQREFTLRGAAKTAIAFMRDNGTRPGLTRRAS